MATTTHKPKLIVFDLDYTLWDFWCDTHVHPPFTKKGGAVYDSSKQVVTTYDGIPEILEALQKDGFKLGIASRTSAIKIAVDLMSLLGLEQFFEKELRQIYPGDKPVHFKRLKEATNIDFRDMLFFDDEERNIRDVSKLGVCSIFVQSGTNHQVVQDGLKTFSGSYKV